MPAKTGMKCKLYYRTFSATFVEDPPDGDWTEVTLIGDLMIDANWAEATGQTRETWVERTARTFMTLNPTGTIRVVDGDSVFTVFDTAFHDPDKLLDVLILNGDKATVGVTGYRAAWELVRWSENQAIGAVLFKDFGLKPGFDQKPQRATVAAGPNIGYAFLDA